jgi:hypothetical protein
MTDRRLIEEAFPLKRVSEGSKHEKNVRHGHVSTLHIWPARRPLAACRAAIIAALMPDPGTEAGRAEMCKKIGSLTRWGTENGPALDYFRQEIRKAYARPRRALLAEATLSPDEMQQLADRIATLLALAPELTLTFRTTMTAEGDMPSAAVLAQLNEVLAQVHPGWKLA